MLPRLVKRLLWRCDMQQLSILSVKETLISSADSLLERRDEFLTCYVGDAYTDHGKFQTLFEFCSEIGDLDS